jgi:hypothetical protein
MNEKTGTVVAVRGQYGAGLMERTGLGGQDSLVI